MSGFIPGAELSRIFYTEAVRPVLNDVFPGLRHTAARIGPGSDVLGYDSARSTDHDWGPRVTLFLTGDDLTRHGPAVHDVLRERLPKDIRGYPTHFVPADARIRVMTATGGPVDHRVELTTIAGWQDTTFGVPFTGTLLDWLSTPTQVFAEATGGAVHHDDLGLTAVRDRLRWYPPDVWRYVLAAQWTLIAEEEAFPGRAREAGDPLGEAVVAARLARAVMRLTLLQQRRWPPYSKWLGTAYRHGGGRGDLLGDLVGAYEAAGRAQNSLRLAEPVEASRRGFHDRPYEVIDAARYAAALAAAVTDPRVAALPAVGAVDQFADSTAVLMKPALRRAATAAVLGIS